MRENRRPAIRRRRYRKPKVCTANRRVGGKTKPTRWGRFCFICYVYRTHEMRENRRPAIRRRRYRKPKVCTANRRVGGKKRIGPPGPILFYA